MKQLSLFEGKGHYSVNPRPEARTMSRDEFLRWKERIRDYQHQARSQKAAAQTTLFDLPQSTWHQPEDIDPFDLTPHPSLFWRMKERPASWDDSSRKGCLYFIVDRTLPLLLYVGETKLSAGERWSGTHDCKDYILNYIQLHRQYDLDVAIASAFWHHVPAQKKTLLEWERKLIYKWRSPFNKEMWRYWGQPFGKTAAP